MNIKSLLIGSAAALVAVSGARAADAIVAAEPEPVEYVRVCDAFGTGYFYIPGTETCLKIGGYVRVQNDFSDRDVNGAFSQAMTTSIAGLAPLADQTMIAQTTRAHFNFSAKSDTEYGMLEGFMAIQANDGNPFRLDQAYLSIGGLKMGYFYHWLDNGLAGETDELPGATTRFNSIKYQTGTGAMYYGVSLDQQTAAWAGNSAAFGNTDGIGVSAIIGGTFGAFSANLVGFYDTNADEGGARLLAFADVGPGTLGVSALYNSGANAYIGATAYNTANVAFMWAEWSVGADYTFKATDKLKLGIAGNYTAFKTLQAVSVDAGDAWKIGATADYAITDGLALKATVNYTAYDASAYVGPTLESETLSGYIRLQRSF